MTSGAPVFREKRLYNSWVSSDTLEDYALRYTADHARKWSMARVVNTALGGAAFLACEAIGAAITLAYGFSNSIAAIGVAVVILFLIGIPIALRSARHGLDMDLLSRGAGFGYLGSTITSLIYACFTFLLFSLEAIIMAVAISELTHIPIALAYILSALAVIPIAIYGMRSISRFQWATQPVWIALQMVPFAYLFYLGPDTVLPWTELVGGPDQTGYNLDIIGFGFALSTLLSLMPQIGEQADYLRFLPRHRGRHPRRWKLAALAGGPGWALIGGAKLALGAFLASFALAHGVAEPDSPTGMYQAIFNTLIGHDRLALLIAAIFIITCQLKINVTNAYAGSIAWSNFFARLTHSHPGRVVWLVFNIFMAIMLMVAGFGETIESLLILYANVAVAWIGALAADLAISKPLGLSPAGIEFKRAHLYDVNPVGIGAMTLSILASGASWFGFFGPIAQAFSPVIGLGVAFVAAPALALITRGRYYIARRSKLPSSEAKHRCVICENEFQRVEMATCPLYDSTICSLCCTLEARCHDRCKTDSRAPQQASRWLERHLPEKLARHVHTPLGHFLAIFIVIIIASAGFALLIASGYSHRLDTERALVQNLLVSLFMLFTVLGGIITWIVVLAHDSRRTAMNETRHQMQKLEEEIAAHEITDARLQNAKEAAETASAAKTRYLVSVCHEIRSPLNSIYGYAQLLERGAGGDITPDKAAKIIRRSAEHLTNLVEGLMDISQVENGVLRISNDTVAFPSFVDQLANMFRHQAHMKGLQFLYERPARLPAFVRTDQKRLRQVLINVLSNAIKFTREGHVKFRVQYRAQMVSFEISDTGPGIAPEEQDLIFVPFERGNNPHSLAQQGVGLGLSITHALVRILGGDIALKSQLGKGTRFTIRLMLGEVVGHTVEPAPSNGIIGYEGRKRTIAIVDDDPAQRNLVRNLLEPIGFTIVEDVDGIRGVILCEERRPDVVLLDISMPGQNGWAAAKAIRESLGHSIKIIMLSADAHEYSPGGTEEDLHDRFLLKPFNLGNLLDTIAELQDIQWVSEEMVEKMYQAEADENQVILPAKAQSHLDEIQRLITIGYVRGIEGAIKTMVEEVPETSPLSVQLLRCLDSFDLRALSELIKRQKT